ncbi:uncharacterized protein LOC134451783 [Engraulis encrasicolus]|uniref:uncharacterized protein LOC134451783 n=1 Tax=Engraulis encrasicolus TaxID=184585 RepID=UPI002FD14C36
MEMSQGTYTFLVCFAGFWLVWGLIVIVCCFCSSVQRRMKRERQEQLREQCLRPLEMEALDFPSSAPPPPLPPPPPFSSTGRSSSLQFMSLDSDPCGQPPCYEEAVLMEDPPPPYNEVLAEPPPPCDPPDPRDPLPLRPTRDSSSSSSSIGGGGGTGTIGGSGSGSVGTLKMPPHIPRVPQEPDISKSNPEVLGLNMGMGMGMGLLPLSLPGQGCSTLIRLPPASSSSSTTTNSCSSSSHSRRGWDSLGRLPTLGLERRAFPLEPQVSFIATMPRDGRTHARAGGPGLGLQLLRELEEDCGLPTAYPLLGRSTAV